MEIGGAAIYRSAYESDYKKVDGFIVVFDITDKKSFEDIHDYFLPKIQDDGNDEIPVIIIGNKSDLKNSREVSIEDAFELASKYNYPYKETSCLNNTNLNEIFEYIIKSVKYYIENKDPYVNHRNRIYLQNNNHENHNLDIFGNNVNNYGRNKCKNFC